MIRYVGITELPAELRERVLKEYGRVLRRDDRRLTYREAAMLYGLTYETMRSYISRGLIRSNGRAPNKWISHAAMRRYFLNRGRGGRPRKALVQAQTSIDQ